MSCVYEWISDDRDKYVCIEASVDDFIADDKNESAVGNEEVPDDENSSVEENESIPDGE